MLGKQLSKVMGRRAGGSLGKGCKWHSDIFLVHFQAARIIAKLAAWGKELMEGSDLNYYFNWIKTQLSSQVTHFF